MKLLRLAAALLAGILFFPAPAARCMAKSADGSAWPSGPNPKKLSSDSAIVMEVSTGSILYEKNIHKKHYPASITKIMTAMLALENSSLNETVTFSSDAVYGIEAGSSTIFSEVDEKMSMEQCIYAIMLESANEVCLAIGEHIAGTPKAFVNMMNEKAAQLGLKDTHFNNPNGLPDPNHYTTAYDMAVIARQAIKNSTFRKITGTRSYTCAKTNKHKMTRIWRNHHQMINGYEHPKYEYKYAIGGKTGYTQAAHNTLVTYAEKDGMQLVAVIMYADGPKQGEPNEYTDTASILDFGFEKYKKCSPNEEAVNINSNLFNNYNSFFNTEQSPIRLSGESSVVLPKGVKLSAVDQEISYFDGADIKEGENVIGSVTYKYGGRVVGSTDIIYRKDDLGHLDEASREIVNDEIADIENSSAKAAITHRRLAKLKRGASNGFAAVKNAVGGHLLPIGAAVCVVVLALLIIFIAKRASAKKAADTISVSRKRLGRRRRRARPFPSSAPARRGRRRAGPTFSAGRRKRSRSYGRRRKNTRESFGKNFFDF